MSPTIIPGYGRKVFGSRSFTTKACKPFRTPSGVTSWANTTACVATCPKKVVDSNYYMKQKSDHNIVVKMYRLTTSCNGVILKKWDGVDST